METSPTPSPSTTATKKRFWKNAIGVSIALFVLPLMFGLAGTVVGMLRTFGELSEQAGADPELLASDIANSMSSTMIGLSFSAVGLVCLIISIVKYRRLSRLPERP